MPSDPVYDQLEARFLVPGDEINARGHKHLIMNVSDATEDGVIALRVRQVTGFQPPSLPPYIYNVYEYEMFTVLNPRELRSESTNLLKEILDGSSPG